MQKNKKAHSNSSMPKMDVLTKVEITLLQHYFLLHQMPSKQYP